MKVLIVLSAVVALSLAKPGYLAGGVAGYAAPGIVAAAHAVPAADVVPAGLVLTPHGVPVDTPAVQAAKVTNAVAHANTNSLALATAVAHGYAAGIVAPGVIAPGLVAGHGVVAAPAVAYAAHAVPAADVVPAGLVLTPHGVPVDTPAVQAARAADAAAHLNAKGLVLG